MQKVDYDSLPQVLCDFLNYEETVKGRSPLTVYEYSLDLKNFMKYLLYSRGLTTKDDDFATISIKQVDLKLLKSVNLSEIYAYLAFTLNERSNKAKTRARKISSLRSFYKYLTSRVDLRMANPTKDLDSPKIKKGLPTYLTVEQSIELLDSIDGNNSKRDYAIITLFLNTGIRLSELVGININDINREDCSLVVLGKGNKERLVYLNKAAMDAVDDYLQVRPKIKYEKALFISRNKKRISPKTVQSLVKKYIEASGLNSSKYSVHKLRHTAATLMYQNGTDLRVLQEILGHADLGTTQIYTHIKNDALKSAFDSNPLSSKKALQKKKDEDNE